MFYDFLFPLSFSVLFLFAIRFSNIDSMSMFLSMSFQKESLALKSIDNLFVPLIRCVLAPVYLL